MGKKIFISYKYSDSKVAALPEKNSTKARHYVDELQDLLEETDHINKGEEDGQSLKDFADETIASKLKDKIYDSSITIVLVSKGMKNSLVSESDQWMPWEISYSLKELSRDGRTSKTNAMLAVVLPDENNNYSYYITDNPNCGSRMLNTPFLFDIMRKNMFNIKNPDTRECNGSTIYNGYSSYITSVKWCDFIKDIDHYIDVAHGIHGNIGSYTITKKVD